MKFLKPKSIARNRRIAGRDRLFDFLNDPLQAFWSLRVNGPMTRLFRRTGRSRGLGDREQPSGTLPAGYTYLGQFIGHDLTFPKNLFQYYQDESLLPRPLSPIPRLQLVSLYGAGPELNPHLYDPLQHFGRTHFALQQLYLYPNKSDQSVRFQTYDFARIDSNRDVAGASQTDRSMYPSAGIHIPMIADVRNDEHVLIAQLHVAFQLFHNRRVEELAKGPRYQSLEKTTRQLGQSSREKMDSVFLPIPDLPVAAHPRFSEKHSEPDLETLRDDLQDFKEAHCTALERFIRQNKIPTRSKNTNVLPEHFSVLLADVQDHFPRSKENTGKGTAGFDEFREKILLPFVHKNNEIRTKVLRDWDNLFREAQLDTIRHFHYLILHDFLPRLVDMRILQDIVPEYGSDAIHKNTRLNLRVYKYDDVPFLPVEFTAAFFRFGHSMVQTGYRFHKLDRQDMSLFSVKSRNQPMMGALDWSLFFFADQQDPKARQRNFAGKIDHRLSMSMLANLAVQRDQNNHPLSSPNIFFRNMERGRRLSLPTGQRIARWMVQQGIVEKNQLEAHQNEKALFVQEVTDLLFQEKDSNLTRENIQKLCHHSPPWFYTLMEAQVCEKGNRLGPVAGRIVAEVLIGIIAAHPHSLFALEQAWKPQAFAGKADRYTMIDFLRYAGVYEPTIQENG